ncbi:MAG: beta-ketoacyl-[acyl-carrier-protein] synthase family protein [Flavobacteriales bacterium]|nr:beta-ketoacyl-[acyl-carrier-protein] synthase family protein [Flavobacteriales bacterium]
MSKRVVITGMGVVAPNAIGLRDFKKAIQEGKSGIKKIQQLEDLKFACQIAGVPDVSEELKLKYFTPLMARTLKSKGILYGCMAGIDAWKDAGFEVDPESEIKWDSGCVFGSGLTGVEVFRDAIYEVDALKVRRLGSRVVEQTMGSGISAHLAGLMGFGNQVTSNSAACSTGSEAITMCYERIKEGKANRMLAGSCDSEGPYIWGGFDSMRVLNRKNNESPEQGSKPMSEDASGFIPGAGAGALVLEELETALARGAKIYGEVIGAAVNSGGQRGEGSMTAPNPEGVKRCILQAIDSAGISPNDIDAICGHLTSTMGDVIEVSNWGKALGRSGDDFPYINSLKSMIGHCLAGAGSIECVATLLQLDGGFFHPSINSENVHPEIEKTISKDKIPQSLMESTNFDVIAKSSFGFGDVNCCIIFKKWNNS